MNIELRERTEAHARMYFEKTRDAEIQAMLPQAAQTLEQALEAYRKSRLPGASSYGRTVYADGQYVGDIWCYSLDPKETPSAMLSYCLFDKAFWGRGIATDALKRFLEEITLRFGLKTVGAFAYCSNIASLRVLEKNGFERAEVFMENGKESAYYQKDVEGGK